MLKQTGRKDALRNMHRNIWKDGPYLRFFYKMYLLDYEHEW